jgi:hypothetical protein
MELLFLMVATSAAALDETTPHLLRRVAGRSLLPVCRVRGATLLEIV